MNHLTSPVARLATIALLVGLSAVACGRHDSPGSAVANPGSQATQASPTVSGPLSGSPNVSVASPEVPTSVPASASSTPAPGQSPTAATTPDPLDSEFQTLDQILGGVNGSISGSGSGSSGGE